MFLAPRKPRSTVLTLFFASNSKNHGIHGIYNVFEAAPSKNTGIYTLFSMLQELLFACQKQKNTVNYNVWDLLLRFPGGWRKEGVLK
jgi:hypothetical protein